MALSDEATERLADVVALQPTKNGELEERWGMDGGSEVHQYLEAELKEYYYRDENSLIRATADAAELVGAEPDDGPRTVRVPELEVSVFDVVADQDDDPESVVSVLHKLRETHDIDPAPDDVRSALRGLARRGVVEVVQRTVPVFRLAVERDSVVVEPIDED
ncbi:DUF5797 family protein [Halococcus hamelinensis]|uniref:Uncharacterized protein n=1 Tax=Halococcus hamelinensis 100A6 TaxID=1132509 RepID=M0M564_9EURY|nr:DUF5797 family protein [Halococcus hamelinensis]EMA39779.1 hypothetical protein C447_05967 [Halococcus hamelinensis 100A6]